MTAEHHPPTLQFVTEFSERDAEEARARGYLSHVVVQFDGDRLYPVLFYDPVRLQQDLEEDAKFGHPFIAEPGMIIVPEVTREAMTYAVEHLAQEGFFEHLRPVTPEDLASSNPYQWPPQLRGGEVHSD